MKKNFKLFSMLLGCLAVLSLSSCLSDSNDNYDAEKEWEEWMKAFRAEVAASHGSYAGYVYYRPDAKSEALDSVAVEWDIVNDSLLVLRRVPTRLFVEKLPEKHASLKEAVSEVGTVNVQVKIAFNAYYKSPLVFYIYPEPVKMDVNVDGEKKAVVINFYDTETNTQSFGQCMVSTSQSLVRLYPKGITLDGIGVKSFDTIDYAYLYWLGKK